MAHDKQIQPRRRPDSPRPVSILTGCPFHIDPRYRRRAKTFNADSAPQDRPVMLLRRHTLSEIVKEVDKQCAHIEDLTQKNGRDALRGRLWSSAPVTPARPMANPTTSGHGPEIISSSSTFGESIKAHLDGSHDLSSPCSDVSSPSYLRSVCKADLAQPCVELPMIPETSQCQYAGIPTLPATHVRLQTNYLASVPQEEPMRGYTAVGAVR